jgi:hypothetical protein
MPQSQLQAHSKRENESSRKAVCGITKRASNTNQARPLFKRCLDRSATMDDDLRLKAIKMCDIISQRLDVVEEQRAREDADEGDDYGEIMEEGNTFPIPVQLFEDDPPNGQDLSS